MCVYFIKQTLHSQDRQCHHYVKRRNASQENCLTLTRQQIDFPIPNIQYLPNILVTIKINRVANKTTKRGVEKNINVQAVYISIDF